MLPTGLALVASAVLGGVVVAAGAVAAFAASRWQPGSFDAPVLAAETWDARSGSWSPAGTLDDRRVDPVLVSLGAGRVLLAGGRWQDIGITGDLVWSASTHAYDAIGGPQIALQCRRAIALPGDRVLFTSSSNADTWGIGLWHAALYDLGAKKWSTIETPDREGVRAAAALDATRVLFVFRSSAAVWRSDTDAWAPGPPTITGEESRDCPSALAVALPDGRVLVLDERFQAADARSWAWIWEPAGGTLVTARALQDAFAALPRAPPGAEVAMDTVALGPAGEIVLAGRDAAYVVPPTLDAVAAFTYPKARPDAAIAVLADGRVLRAGGTVDGAAVRDAEVIDPRARRVETTGSLLEARAGAGAVALPGGAVLVAGGSRAVRSFHERGFAELLVPTLVALVALAGFMAIVRRSRRRALVVATAFVGAVLVAVAGTLLLLYAIGSAIKG